jgi:hypothetical protein
LYKSLTSLKAKGKLLADEEIYQALTAAQTAIKFEKGRLT